MGLQPSRISRAFGEYDLVVLVSLLWFMVQFLRFVFPPLFGTFQANYNVSNAQTGILFTALMLAYSSVQVPAGLLGDRRGEPAVIVGGAVLFTTAALVVATSPAYTILLGGAVLIGLGTGPHKTVTITLLSRRYSDNHGLALGVMDTIGQLGGTVAPLVVVVITTVLSWQAVFILGAGVSALLCWLFYARVKRDPKLTTNGSIENRSNEENNSSGATGDRRQGYWTILRNRSLLGFMVVTVTFTFAWNGVSAFFPLFLASEKGLSSDLSGVLYSVLFIASVSQTITGGISDRFDRLSVGFSLFVLAFCAMGLILVVDSLPLLFVLTAAAGVGFHGFRPVRDSYLMEIIPTEVGSGTLGIIRTCMTGIGALAPAVVGILSDAINFVAAFSVIIGLLAFGSAVLLVLR